MRIRYENTLEDMVAFNRYHCEHSAAARRAKALWTWVPPAIALMLAVPLAVLHSTFQAVTFVVVYVPLHMLLIVPLTFQRSIDRQVRKLYSEGGNKGMLCDHELELTETGLVERTAYGEQLTRMEGIEKIGSDARYTFIYVGSVMAHVIPHDAVFEGDCEALVEAVKTRMAAELEGGSSRFFARDGQRPPGP